MRKKIMASVFVVALLVAMAVPLFGSGTAQAIVHPVTPITCNGAVGASGGAAGGAAAIGSVNVEGGRTIPMTSPQGKAHAVNGNAVCAP
ncbi:MAG: hypothetical protein IIA23_09580 [Chloroflexi bacterium]|nr:hypothetical protein [Chloroflexota bacterium]